MSKINIIPIFVPHYGCPNDCVFCNQVKITGFSTDISNNIVKDTILEYLSYFKNKSDVEVAFYGGSFTAIDVEKQKELLSVAKYFKCKNLIHKIRLSTRPDAINSNILEMLNYYMVDTIELGVQSLDKEVLLLSNRGHSPECVYESSRLIKEYGFNLGLQQMVGLPGDDFSKSLYTTEEFIKIEPDCVRIYPTLVIKDTELERELKCGRYKAQNLNESISYVADLLYLYYKNNINVIRVGLQATENINFNKDVVAGPFHPAYRQFVESEIFFNSIKNFLSSLDLNIKEMIIYSSNENISSIAGQNAKNKERIIKYFNLKNLKIKSKNLDDFHISIFANDKIYDFNILDYYKMENKCI